LAFDGFALAIFFSLASKRALLGFTDPARSHRTPSTSLAPLPRLVFLDLNQSYRPTPPYSIEGMNDIVPIQYSQQALHRSRRIPRSGLNVFPEDAPCVLDSPNDCVLVGVIHDAPQPNPDSIAGRVDSFRSGTTFKTSVFVMSQSEKPGRHGLGPSKPPAGQRLGSCLTEGVQENASFTLSMAGCFRFFIGPGRVRR
jgi:hypothetical protein